MWLCTSMHGCWNERTFYYPGPLELKPTPFPELHELPMKQALLCPQDRILYQWQEAERATSSSKRSQRPGERPSRCGEDAHFHLTSAFSTPGWARLRGKRRRGTRRWGSDHVSTYLTGHAARSPRPQAALVRCGPGFPRDAGLVKALSSPPLTTQNKLGKARQESPDLAVHGTP
jgi:hypothetical protein